ncbi:MAG: ATP-binding protein [Bacteroidetes bacterium]|nr:ATP-binding protein [Bacteroidota bacterium]
MVTIKNKKLEDLKKASRSVKPADAISALLQLSELYNKDRNKRAFTCARQALEKAIQFDRKENIGEAHLQLAIYFCRARTDYITSLNHCEKALQFKAAFKTKRELAEIFKTMGVNYFYLGELRKAQDNYKNALNFLLSISKKEKEEIKDVADLYYNLAILNRSVETIHLRKEFLEESQKYYQQINMLTGVARCYDGMGVYHFYAGNTKKAMELLLLAIKTFEEENDKEGVYLASNNIGTIKIKTGKFNEGLAYLMKSLQLRKKSGNPIPIAISYINIGNALMDKRRFKEAIVHLSDAEKILRKTKSKIELASLMSAMSRCYKHTKNFEKAVTCQAEYILLHEELHRYELEKAYNDTTARYDMELMEKNAMIDRLKNFEIASYIHRLEMSNTELRQFAHAASHDLKEPLRTITSFVNLLEKHCENKIDRTGREYLNYIITGTKRLDELVKDLLNLSRINLSETTFTDVNLNEVFKDAVVNLSAIITEKNARVHCGKLPIISADKTQMFQLFMNLIANGIKYNQNKIPDINIRASKKGAHITISFSDNGIGIAEQYQTKIFEIFQRLHPREKYSGTGIGLTICKKIVDRHHGKIWVKKNKPNGSVFHVSLPA